MPDDRNTSIRVRMAPSPTGRLHLGTARIALFNYLFARKYGGKFVLRIEDTDVARSNPEFESDILENLRWLGIAWDEGPDIGGPYGPYRQSERTASYRTHLEKLLTADKAYWCFCTAEMLEQERQRAQANGTAPRYSGICRAIGRDDAARRQAAGERAVIRFKMPENAIAHIIDLVRGTIEFDAKNFDDFVVAKSLIEPLYNFAVVVDDFDMRITHVIRGEDHISNTPKQQYLIEALGFPRVAYAHLPLTLGSDRSKMSKRHGSVAVSEYRQMGYLPKAMFNFLALLGWSPGTDEEILSEEEIIERFSLEGIQKSGAIFNQEKLDWMNGMYIRNLSDADLAGKLLPFLIEAGLLRPFFVTAQSPPAYGGYTPISTYTAADGRDISPGQLEAIAAILRDRLKKFSEVVELAVLYKRKVSAYFF